MTDAKIGRVLVASLHQAIADILPTRLEFYENWLNSSGLREGRIGLPAVSAVLSFLRAEGEAYARITARAGAYAADWSVEALPVVERRALSLLPVPLRARVALRVARALVRRTYGGSRALVRLRRGTATVDLRGSLFCEVRETGHRPLCSYYAAAFSRVCERFHMVADAQIASCRGTGANRCTISLVLRRVRAEGAAAA